MSRHRGPGPHRGWETLASVTPGGQLAGLALFAGFSGGDASDSQDEVTQTFVNVVDDDSRFQMSVNLDEIEADADVATLTMVHEFSHVFTALPSELDRTVPPGECANYDNGEGCYVTGSIMAGWAAERGSPPLRMPKNFVQPRGFAADSV